ncbi:MAG: response regulator [Acidobacteria bacterium]|nr:response regulator [Acidobacteriota bacterium]
MKILLVDDSTTIRMMLRRALAGLQQTDIAEAQNGLEALAEIGRRRFDLAILDINMPVMDGLETLEAIRASPLHAGLPVVVLTSEKSEGIVRRLVEMGIADYLSKPLSQDRLSDRLSHIISRLTQSAAPSPTLRAAEHGQRVLVVEHDPDRRHFLVNVLAQHFKVVETDSGAGALQLMLGQAAPVVDVVLMGEQIGLPPAELFISKMKTVPPLSRARVVACRRKAGAQGSPSPDLVDAMVDWTYVPEVFLAAFERAVTGVDTPLAGMPSFRASLERDAVCATEQLFGLMLSSEVALVPPGGTPRCPWPGRGLHARLDLVAPGTASFAVLFRADDVSAAAITAQLIGVTPEEVDESDVKATAAEFANIIAGRLRNRLIEAGMSTQMQLPTTWTGATTDGFPASDVATLTFNSTRPPASFELLLCVGCAGTIQVRDAA